MRLHHPIEQEEVMAYLDGELPIDQAAKAAAHLQECQPCQQFVTDLRSVSQAMTDWETEWFDGELDSQLVAAREERKQQSTADVLPSRWHNLLRLSRWPPWAWVTAPAGIAALLIAGMLMLHTAPVATNNDFSHATRGVLSPGDRDRLSSLEYDARKAVETASSAVHVAETTTTSQNGSPAPNVPMIARTAELSIATKDFEAARIQVDEIVKRQSGYIGEMNVFSPPDAKRKLTAVLRVPADRLEAAIAELKKVGRVESESQAGEEVTSQYVDLQARLTNARNTEQRLIELLRTRTGKLEEVVAVEEKLSEVREQIERMEAQKKDLTKRVDFGKLTLSLEEEHLTQMRMVPQSSGTQLHNAAVEGYRSVVDGGFNALLFLMSWGPSLLLWGAILFFPARYIWRRLRAKAA